MKIVRILAAITLAAIFLVRITGVGFAHGQTEVGIYELVIGFHIEPAYQGEPNGLDLFVTNSETGERVNGLEETLQVEIIYGSSTRALEIEPQFGQEGAYTAHLIPTAAGDYTWHIFGTIENTPVDVRMTSSPTTFGAVVAKSVAAFPAAEPNLEAVNNQATNAAGAARTALLIGAAGALFGLAGLFFGFMGWMAARRVQSTKAAEGMKKAL
jgi:hypothetical protein